MQNLKAELIQQNLNQEQKESKDTFFLFCLVGSWLFVGLLSTLFGFFNLLRFPLFGLLAFPIYFLVFELKEIVKEGFQKSTWLLVVCTVCILLLHATGIFTPETGFDAVWYHLPVLDYFKEVGAITYKPDLYQTANPLLSDMLFYPAFQLLGGFGAKITAYLLGLSLVVMVYRLSRQVLNISWSWWLLITMLLMQPIAWQMSSFYVDIAKAFWEVSLLVWFLKKRRSSHVMYLVGILLGASIATKAFSILLLPIVPVMLVLSERKEKLAQFFLFLVGLLTIISPFYLYTWFSTGSPFISVGIHLQKLQEIGGSSSFFSYLLRRTGTLPVSWWYLLTAKDYITLAIPLLLPVFIGMCNKLYVLKKKTLVLLCSFAVLQWLVWWFVPPVSTRYALSGFVVALVVLFWATQELIKRNTNLNFSITITLLLMTIWHLLPRLIVLNRNSIYLLGVQTKREYVQQFYDGNADLHLDNWYKKN